MRDICTVFTLSHIGISCIYILSMHTCTLRYLTFTSVQGHSNPEETRAPRGEDEAKTSKVGASDSMGAKRPQTPSTLYRRVSSVSGENMGIIDLVCQ
jgi:hypothetical protein